MTETALTPTKPRPMRLIAMALVATVALVALDLWSKDWAARELSFARPGDPPPICAPDEAGYRYTQRVGVRPLVLIDGYLELKYAENCGAAFGLLRQAPNYLRHAVFGVAATAASVVLSWMFVMGRGGPLFAWSVPLIVSGAVGNLIDRARLGYVIDFIAFHLQDGFEWPTFNVADCGITIGVALLVLDGFLDGRRETAGKVERAAEAGAG